MGRERNVRSKRKQCPIRIDGVFCAEKTLRGSKFCKKHAKLVTTEFIPCTGEAHSNSFIDHCSMCMPHWGSREVLKVIEGSHEHQWKKFEWRTQCTECGVPKDEP